MLVRNCRRFVLALALACAVLPLSASAASLPRLEADSMGGTHVVLPDDAAGKKLVLVLAFTREAQTDLARWSRRLLQQHLPPTTAFYVVVVVDKASFVSRKHIRSLVAGAAVGSKEQVESNVLVTFNGAGWRDLVPPGDKQTAGVVVCDASGAIVFAKREAYGESSYKDVQAALSR